jgi:antitoxin HicB
MYHVWYSAGMRNSTDIWLDPDAAEIKRRLAAEFSQEMRRQGKTKLAMARNLRTSRSQLDRLLDQYNVAISLESMARAARALGKRLVVRMENRQAD